MLKLREKEFFLSFSSKNCNFKLISKLNMVIENLKRVWGHIKVLGGPHVARGSDVAQARVSWNNSFVCNLKKLASHVVVSRRQFHQHFTRAFLVRKFGANLFCACSEG
jgi:hypothetical protein